MKIISASCILFTLALITQGCTTAYYPPSPRHPVTLMGIYPPAVTSDNYPYELYNSPVMTGNEYSYAYGTSYGNSYYSSSYYSPGVSSYYTGTGSSFFSPAVTSQSYMFRGPSPAFVSSGAVVRVR